MEKEVVEGRKSFAIVDQEIEDAEMEKSSESFMKKISSMIDEELKALRRKFIKDSSEK